MNHREERLLTVKELREVLGRDRVSDHTAYAIARIYGVRLGRRLLVPAHVVEMVLRKTGEHEGAVIPPDSSGGYTDPLALLRYHEGGKCLS